MEEEKPKNKNTKRKSIAQKDLVNYLFNKYVFKRDNNNDSKDNNVNNRDSDKLKNDDNKFKLEKPDIKKKNFFTIEDILEKNTINKILLKKGNKENENSFITRLQIKKNVNDE